MAEPDSSPLQHREPIRVGFLHRGSTRSPFAVFGASGLRGPGPGGGAGPLGPGVYVVDGGRPVLPARPHTLNEPECPPLPRTAPRKMPEGACRKNWTHD
jgi:hypothetical protein